MAGNYQQPMTGSSILCALFGKGWAQPNAIQDWNRSHQSSQSQTSQSSRDQVLADVVLIDVDKHEAFVAWNQQLVQLTGQDQRVMSKEGGLARVSDIPDFAGYARFSPDTGQLVDINQGQQTTTSSTTREAVGAGSAGSNSP